jgi:EAL domain-containing protein (putative c-di-GMP-specific phosphodiesterase class I)
LLDVVSVPLPYRDTRIIVGASIGIAISSRDGTTADDLLRCADAAMYAAKKRGGNSIEHFRPELHRTVIEELNLERALRFALERNAIELAFQPIVSARTGRPVALEALARWTERGRYIDPSDFIRLAEQTGLIARLGNFVLERACLQMQRLLDAGYGRLSMAVNISARQFREPGFVDSVRATLARTNLAPDRLVLEITESAYIDSAAATLDAMKELSGMGVRLALDDFGTGYSALGYLKRLPVDEIKIDRSFVENVTTDSADESIVRAIVGVAKNLDLTVVAEGVETAEQAAFLLGLGCNRFQGYHFSRPLAPADLDIYLAASEGG